MSKSPLEVAQESLEQAVSDIDKRISMAETKIETWKEKIKELQAERRQVAGALTRLTGQASSSSSSLPIGKYALQVLAQLRAPATSAEILDRIVEIEPKAEGGHASTVGTTLAIYERQGKVQREICIDTGKTLWSLARPREMAS